MENSKISLQKSKIDFLILVNIAFITLALCLINFSNIDLVIQKYLFDFKTKSWLIDRDEPVKKFIFYQLPKILMGTLIITLLVLAILGFRKKSEFLVKNRHHVFLIFLGLSLIPLIAGNIKTFTNVYCPNRLEIFMGDMPYVKIFDSYPADFHQKKKAKCFPAGHAVSGFALMILFFGLRKKSHRLIGLASGVILGWITGFYQIAKGAHFFGDTLVSMLVCFFLAALITRIYLNFQEL